MILAELGADVIKVERPGGDDTRAWGPPFWGDDGTMFLAVNRGKRSVVLDLRADSSRLAMTRLRAGALEKLGYGYDWAVGVNPSLIYCRVGAYGTPGPLSEQPGYDAVLQAFGGIMSVNGEPDGGPARVGVSLLDMGTGLWAALAVLAALIARESDGLGRRITTSLYETSLAWMTYHLESFFATGEVARVQSSVCCSVRGLPNQ